jgi:hypothetical protein
MATNTPEASPTLDLLEKNSTDKLDKTERDNIKNLTMPGVQNALKAIEQTTFKLSDKNPKVSLDTIIKNYHATGKYTGEIRLNGEKIPVQGGSDLAAWIQIFLIAKDHYLVSNDASNIGIDAVIGENTNQAIADYRKDGTSTPINTIPNQPEGNVDLSITEITPTLKYKIMESIAQVDLKSIKGDKFQKQFVRALNNGILDANYKVRGAVIDAKTKEYVIKIIEPKTGLLNKEYRIRLDKILKNEEGAVNKPKFANELYAIIGLIYNDKMANNKKLATEKEKKGLEDLTKEWNNLQREATNKINKAKTWEEKIKLTDQYSGKYATLSKKITTTKVSYVKAEQTKLAAHINQQKTNLDTTNILTNCPQHINERYAAFKKNVGT